MRPARAAPLLLLGLALACAKAPLPMPVPVAVEEFVVPWPDAFPSDLVADDRGRIWFTDRLISAIGRFDPADGSFERFDTPTPGSAPYGFVRGPDGGLWYAASQVGGLGRIDPVTGVIEEVRLEGVRGGPHLLAVEGGRIWFTAREGGVYGSLDVATRESRVYRAPDGWKPYGIAAAGGYVWVAGIDGPGVLRIDPATDSVARFAVTPPDPDAETITSAEGDRVVYRRRPGAVVRARRARVRRMTGGPGGRVWLTDFGGGRVLAVRPDGTVESFESLNLHAEPYGIGVDADGRVWYYEKGESDVVALDAASGERVRFPVPTRGAVARNILALDGAVWLPLSDGGRIGRIRVR